MNDSQSTNRANQESPEASPPKKKRGLWWVTKRALIVLALMLLLLVVLNFRMLPGPNSRLVRPSPETTWITEPLKPNGDVDYLAWVNEQGRIPPGENAFVELIKVLGPSAYDFELNDEVYALLGVSVPPASGDYLERFVYARESRRGLELTTTINGVEIDGMHATWLMEEVPITADQFPEAIKWYERNERHLETIRNAVRKPSYWATATGNNLSGTTNGSSVRLREIAKILQRSSMRHLGDNDARRAIEDQMSVLRIGRHISQNGPMLDFLVGIGVDGFGYSALEQTLYGNVCSPGDLEMIANELESLPHPTQLNSEHIKIHRAVCLNELLMIGRTGPMPVILRNLDYSEYRSWDTFMRASIGWAGAFQTTNEWFDRFEAAFEAKSADETREMLEQLTDELTIIIGEGDFDENVKAALFWGLAGRGQFVGNRLVAEANLSMIGIFDAGLEHLAIHEVTRAAVAVERYRLKYGAPPAKLADITPEFLPLVPIDPFAATELVYRLDPEQQYVLYSLGRNRRDDGGTHSMTISESDIVAGSSFNTMEDWIDKHIPKKATINQPPGFQP